jgi:hypothetical protein
MALLEEERHIYPCYPLGDEHSVTVRDHDLSFFHMDAFLCPFRIAQPEGAGHHHIYLPLNDELEAAKNSVHAGPMYDKAVFPNNGDRAKESVIDHDFADVVAEQEQRVQVEFPHQNANLSLEHSWPTKDKAAIKK